MTLAWLCGWIGHEVRTMQSDELCSFVAPNNWQWPGVVSYCPRCGLVYRNAGRPDKIPPPFQAESK